MKRNKYALKRDGTMMKLEECMKCSSHIDSRADSVLCKYENEMESRVLDKDTVVGCPKINKSKSLF
jgi:hypothetical protein